ncbi:uncharacterized protein CC84DRAFT_829649 [Paraphaeosphaeria sporulosa]|uniref:Uncharacterized protein n=1 Tax=Paraphaeosphaeria sporulosa TaxID=1460663 RepID=A0A177CBX8_9PLEO|nr:uncharacterized protein CC84DRAFT_829649 [Paraphaeosphaeria sporulosa]OAG05164.1 hypothetical protein CC84DRAFT_829649 [Paraphaeosphaeria sporulosa]
MTYVKVFRDVPVKMYLFGPCRVHCGTDARHSRWVVQSSCAVIGVENPRFATAVKNLQIPRSTVGARPLPSVCDSRGLHSMAECAGKDVGGSACVVYSEANNNSASSGTASPPRHPQVTMVPASEAVRGGVSCEVSARGLWYICKDVSRRWLLGGDTTSRFPLLGSL